MYSEHRIDLKKISEQKLLQKERSFQMSGSKKVDFKVPAPSPPGHHGEPGTSAFPSSCPSAQLTSSQKQLDGGPSGPLDGNSSFLGPCQPRTRVNLKGVVCCETEGAFLSGNPGTLSCVVAVNQRSASEQQTGINNYAKCSPDPKVKRVSKHSSFSEWRSRNPELRGGREPEKRKRTTDGDHNYTKRSPDPKVKRVSKHSSGKGRKAGVCPTSKQVFADRNRVPAVYRRASYQLQAPQAAHEGDGLAPAVSGEPHSMGASETRKNPARLRRPPVT
ncbi:uncharacterized protein LOC114462502 isoform X1 [Gouania willdenowi]|uniref:uncharacterized protein LOC114462502 isoform X1 n=1 Tax=Gouania willdenowi TaxID=441366 RepID=UPI00105583C7|nr:uncharacterized protein LOC114462502 isoform X1 [Gouania willdenowi]